MDNIIRQFKIGPAYSAAMAFHKECVAGHLDRAQLLYRTFTDIQFDYDRIFIECCCNGHYNIIQFLMEITTLQLSDDAFTNACMGGHLILAQWLYNQSDFIVDEKFFTNVCKNKNVSVIKWLMTILPIDNTTMESAFSVACEYGNIDVAKYLYDIDPCIINNINMSVLFVESATHTHCEVMEWLLEICPTINYHTQYKYIFHRAIHNYNITAIRWLIELYSRSICMEFIDNFYLFSIPYAVKYTIQYHDIKLDEIDQIPISPIYKNQLIHDIESVYASESNKKSARTGTK